VTLSLQVSPGVCAGAGRVDGDGRLSLVDPRRGTSVARNLTRHPEGRNRFSTGSVDGGRGRLARV